MKKGNMALARQARCQIESLVNVDPVGLTGTRATLRTTISLNIIQRVSIDTSIPSQRFDSLGSVIIDETPTYDQNEINAGSDQYSMNPLLADEFNLEKGICYCDPAGVKTCRQCQSCRNRP